MHASRGVSAIELHGIYFWIDMHRIALQVTTEFLITSQVVCSIVPFSFAATRDKAVGWFFSPECSGDLPGIDVVGWGMGQLPQAQNS